MNEKGQEQHSQKDVWHKNDTIYLVKFITELKPNALGNENFSNILYMQVANKLFDLGYSRTYIQCKNKWKEVIASFKKYRKSLSGEPPPYYSELDKLLTHLPNGEDVSKDVAENVTKYDQPWSQYETTFLLKVMRIGNFVYKLKTEDPSSVYEDISKYLFKIGPISRSKDEIRRRWKGLKNSYVKYIRGDILHFKYFESMDALLDWEPNSVAFEEDQFKDGHDVEDDICDYPDDFEAKAMPTSKRSLNWSFAETEKLLDVVQKYDVKRMKRENLAAIFDEASIQLRLQGFKRSAEQCRVKFKHLKVKYFSVYRRVMEGDTRHGHSFYHFDRMKEILHSSPSEVSSDQELSQDAEQYEVEYLEEEAENFEQVFLTEETASQASKKSRMIWSHAETRHLLNILKAKNVKRYCRRPIFEDVAYEMEKAGFQRSAQTCMIKWKNLRNQLYTCMRNLSEGSNDVCPFYNEICEIVESNGSIDLGDPIDTDEIDDEQMEQNAAEEEKLHVASGESTDGCGTIEVKKRKSSIAAESTASFDSDEKSSKKFKNISADIENSSDSCKNTCDYKMDDIEHYCMSLSTTFKRLSEKKRAKLKIEIQKLLYMAEFGEDF